MLSILAMGFGFQNCSGGGGWALVEALVLPRVEVELAEALLTVGLPRGSILTMTLVQQDLSTAVRVLWGFQAIGIIIPRIFV